MGEESHGGYELMEEHSHDIQTCGREKSAISPGMRKIQALDTLYMVRFGDFANLVKSPCVQCSAW